MSGFVRVLTFPAVALDVVSFFNTQHESTLTEKRKKRGKGRGGEGKEGEGRGGEGREGERREREEEGKG